MKSKSAMKVAFAGLFGLLAIAAAYVALTVPPSQVMAQTPALFGPYNTDLGVQITNTLRTAGTVTSAQIVNADKRGVVCTFFQTAVSGSPSTTFSIQGYDAATNSYNTLVTSSAITTSTTNVNTITVMPGAVSADAPSNGVVKGIPLPRVWRLSQTVAGTAGPATTSKIGCNAIK